jgi:ABC-type multidrug transport system fused ATPase/permease subunit
MKKYLGEQIRSVEDSLKKKNAKFSREALEDFRTRIGFFQHERLIHLLITLFFSLMFVISVIAALMMADSGSGSIFLDFGLLVISFIFLIMLGFYIGHYFILENGVQKLYRLDREIAKRRR